MLVTRYKCSTGEESSSVLSKSICPYASNAWMVWRIGEALVQPTHASNVSEDALAKPWYNLRASNVIGE